MTLRWLHWLRLGLAAAMLAVMLGSVPGRGDAQTNADAASDGLRYFLGLTLATDYVANGISQTGGLPTIQPLFELDKRGFYAGTVLSLVRLDTDRAELDLYLGYRRKLANGLFIDTGYRRYLFNNTGDCCGEFKLRLLSPLVGDLGGEVYLGYNPELKSFNRRARLIWAADDRLTVTAAYGETSGNQNEYWDAGVTYALTTKVALDLRYQGAESGDAGVVVKLSWATVDNSLARVLADPLGQ